MIEKHMHAIFEGDFIEFTKEPIPGNAGFAEPSIWNAGFDADELADLRLLLRMYQGFFEERRSIGDCGEVDVLLLGWMTDAFIERVCGFVRAFEDLVRASESFRFL